MMLSLPVYVLCLNLVVGWVEPGFSGLVLPSGLNWFGV